MLKNKDIIIVGLQAWDIEIGSNCKNLALEFSKHNRVLYVNSPNTYKDNFVNRKDPRTQKRKRIVKGKQDSIEKINENLYILFPKTTLFPIHQIKNNTLFDYFNKINNKRYAKEIKKAADKMGFKNYIIFNDSDMFRSFHLKELLKPEVYIYYTRDNLISMPYWKKQGVRVEAKHMAKADLVVANSTYLRNLASKFNPKSFYVGQGCDVSHFKAEMVKNIPEDIKEIKSPIIGYIGALINHRLDIEILIHIAKQKPEWNIVLVGPEDEHFKKSELHNLKNVYFLGNKKANELPDYLYKFDIALNPQILSPLTIGNYPRKIDEYLAMGKATVATKTEAMSVFADYTYLGENKEDYVSLIEKALKEDNEEKQKARSKFASQHSWENNAKEIYKRIDDFLNSK